MVSKAFAVSTKTIPNSLCSFFACLTVSCIKFRFSEHPAACINPLCLGFMGHALVNLAIKILENNLNTVEAMVIGLQLLMSLSLSTLVDLGIKTDQHSLRAAGIVLVMSRKLKISINREYLGCILTRQPNVIPCGPESEFFLISLIFFSTSFSIIRAVQAVLSASFYEGKDSRPMNNGAIAVPLSAIWQMGDVLLSPH